VGPAAFQFNFQATLNGRRLSDKHKNDPMNGIFEGSISMVNLEPGKEFNRHVDLKGWFAFDKAGTYKIHGSYWLKIFNKSGSSAEAHQMWNEMWSGNVSTDFMIIVK
jgi:hypothetical protein